LEEEVAAVAEADGVADGAAVKASGAKVKADVALEDGAAGER